MSRPITYKSVIEGSVERAHFEDDFLPGPALEAVVAAAAEAASSAASGGSMAARDEAVKW